MNNYDQDKYYDEYRYNGGWNKDNEYKDDYKKKR